jgi:hypothetical protein
MSSIAFLPVVNTQKNSFNFKELSKLLDEMVANVSKSVVELSVSETEELTEEKVQSIIMSSIETVYKKEEVKKVKAKRPKQALTSYILFCKANRASVKEENGDLDPKDITRKLASMWKDLSDEEKQPFIDESKREAEKLKAESSNTDEEVSVEKKKSEKKTESKKTEKKSESKKSESTKIEKKAENKKSEKKSDSTKADKKSDSTKSEKPKTSKKTDIKAPAIDIDEEEPILTSAEPPKKKSTKK